LLCGKHSQAGAGR